jgi:hypothetical protein
VDLRRSSHDSGNHRHSTQSRGDFITDGVTNMHTSSEERTFLEDVTIRYENEALSATFFTAPAHVKAATYEV